MTETKADLQAENERLTAENAELRAEVERLSKVAGDVGTANAQRPAPQEPSFGVTEGMRADLELNGEATSPFTGKRYTLGDDGQPVEAEEPDTAVDSTPDNGQR